MITKIKIDLKGNLLRVNINCPFNHHSDETFGYIKLIVFKSYNAVFRNFANK